MSINLSLKYRIAVLIFLLEAIMMAVVLGATLTSYFDANTKLSNQNERVLINILSDLARVALLNVEYGELQPYVEEFVTTPAVEKVIVLDEKDRVVVSSTVTDVGGVNPQFISSENQFWRTQEIENSSGRLGKIAIKFSHHALVAANERAVDVGIITALAGMLIIAVCGVIAGYLLTRRLETLKNAALKMISGDLSVRTGLHGKDEIAILSETFDRMAQGVEIIIHDLRDREKEISNAHDELEKRIAERTRELAIARDQALAANRTKSVFLANMSHELRTPLNAIIGYCELLSEVANDNRYKDIISDLDNIHVAGTHLLKIINNVLDLSKIEAGKVTFELTNFDIEEMVNEVVTNTRPLVHKNNNNLEVLYGKEVGSMYADKTKVRQILINVIGNAAKFTEAGTITLSVDRQKIGKNIIFTIRDTGIGISEENLHKLFEEFTQADASTTRKFGGTGLGLAISRHHCELMGGHIVASSSLGKGSSFTVILPVSVTLAAEVQIAQNHVVVGQSIK